MAMDRDLRELLELPLVLAEWVLWTILHIIIYALLILSLPITIPVVIIKFIIRVVKERREY